MDYFLIIQQSPLFVDNILIGYADSKLKANVGLLKNKKAKVGLLKNNLNVELFIKVWLLISIFPIKNEMGNSKA